MKNPNNLYINKTSKIISVTLFYLFSFFIFTSSVYSQKLLIGYYPDYKKGVAPAENLHLENLTHIIHSFAYPDENGNLQYSNQFLYPELIETVHNAGKKIILGLGGWGNEEGFVISFADSTKRVFFANNVIQFCETYGYDGIDIDWEYPATPSERTNLNKFVADIKEKKPNLSISLAVPGTDGSAKYIDFTFLEPYVDWIGLMAYDMAGGWSTNSGHNAPLYSTNGSSVDSYLKYMTQTRGVQPEKIVLGVPFYGYSFKTSGLGHPNGGTTSVTYIESMLKIIDGWEYKWDNISKVPYLISPQKDYLISYDNDESIRLKCDYAIDQNLAGVMIWELSHDFIKGDQPLLENLGIKLLHSMGSLTSTVKIANIPNGFKMSTVDTVSILVNASDSIGAISKVELYLDSTKIGEVISEPYSFTMLGANKGVHILKALAYNSSGIAKPSDRIFIKVIGDTTATQTPYNGLPFTIPGKIEAEEFDFGGESVSYHDTSPNNAAAGYSNFRLEEDVDCEPMNEGGFNVGYTIDNEWLEYSVVIDSSTIYSLSFYVASGSSGGSFHLEIDNVDVTGTINTPGTGGWGTYVTINKRDVDLNKGEHILKLFVEKGDFNIDNIIFDYQLSTDISENELNQLSYKLFNNYPNPFNPTTNISFSIPNDGRVSLVIYNMLSQKVKTLINNEQTGAGNFTLSVDMSGLSSGIYLYNLTYGNQILSKKMMFLK